MQTGFPKPINRKLNQLASIAHERALRASLAELAKEFGRWERGEIDSFDLNDRIHAFHDGPSRELHNRYTGQDAFVLPVVVANATSKDCLDRETIGDDVWPYVERGVNSIKS